MSSIRISVGEHVGTPSLVLTGELDADAREDVDRALVEMEAKTDHLVIDLSGLDFMDSTGLHVILSAHERAINAGRQVSIIRGSPHVQKVFEVTGVDVQLNFLE